MKTTNKENTITKEKQQKYSKTLNAIIVAGFKIKYVKTNFQNKKDFYMQKELSKSYSIKPNYFEQTTMSSNFKAPKLTSSHSHMGVVFPVLYTVVTVSRVWFD